MPHRPLRLAARFALTLAAAAAVSVPAARAAEDAKSTAPSPDEAVARLMEGNARFVEGDMEHPNLGQEVREDLAKGQAPFAVIVSCSDSRVPPEIVFDAGPGDLFVIRVAGNVVEDHALASIEYAVANLGTPLVMVMGHESCGAVGAAVASEKGEASFDGHIHDLVETIRPAVQAAMEHAQGDEVLDAAVKENAVRVKEQLSNSKPYVGEYASEGKIKLLAARYDLDSGKVTLIDGKAEGEGKHDHHAE